MLLSATSYKLFEIEVRPDTPDIDSTRITYKSYN